MKEIGTMTKTAKTRPQMSATIHKPEWEGSWSTSYIRNRDKYLQGLDMLKRSAFRLDGRHKNWWAVAVIVGAGPSLDNSIADLKRMIRRNDKLQGKQRCAVIYATDAALKPLLAAGIRPDYVVTMDENKFTEHFYTETGVSNMDLVASVTTPTCVVDDWLKAENSQRPNRVWFFVNANKNVYDDRWEFGLREKYLTKLPWVRSEFTNSVAMTALNVAQRAGFRHFFLVGCDFHVANGKTHCKGMAVNAPEAHRTEAKHYQMCVDAMKFHLTNIHSVKNRNSLPVYNCSAGGKLKWNNMPLHTAGERFKFIAPIQAK
ncbi:DUF115 domain-containing protein [bacterium]|nr:DUF115 domain-containing protein [bacterium]